MESSEKLPLVRATFTSGNLTIEALILEQQSGKAPGVLYLHGHRSSCWESTLIIYRLFKAGFTVVAPSLPGYGLSQGKLDYCGPATQKAAVDAAKILAELPSVGGKLGVWGISRGATVAMQLATAMPGFWSACVAQSGAYEMKAYRDETQQEGIREAIDTETGGSDEALRARSPIYAVESIDCPVLILHGDQDDRIPYSQATLLQKRLGNLAKDHQLVTVTGGGHLVTRDTLRAHTLPFLGQHLALE